MDPKGKPISSDFCDVMVNFQMLLDILKKANLLFVMLSSRFLTHVKWKVKLCQQSNRCFPWASKNLALVASWMIVASHVEEDISCLDESKYLLANPGNNKFLVCLNKELSHLGCYLHYNQNKVIWIQSGSATGKDGFCKHLKTHQERALSDRNNDDSHFYHYFPFKSSEHAKSYSKEGYFEYLTAYVGVGFSAECPPGCFSKSGGLLMYTKEEEKWIRDLNFRGKTGNHKNMQMAAYLFELGYELALARKDNVSDSPGFEACGLIFDKTATKF